MGAGEFHSPPASIDDDGSFLSELGHSRANVKSR